MSEGWAKIRLGVDAVEYILEGARSLVNLQLHVAATRYRKEQKAIPKYLMLWEIDASKAPVNPKERGATWTGMLNMIKQDMKDGKVIDWGVCPGEARGYSIMVMPELDLAKNLQRFYPHVTFKVNQVMTVDQILELAKSLSG